MYMSETITSCSEKPWFPINCSEHKGLSCALPKCMMIIKLEKLQKQHKKILQEDVFHCDKFVEHYLVLHFRCRL